MLELQHKPLHHKTEYALDVLLDEMSIDGAAATAVRLYGDRKVVNDIIDNKPIDPSATAAQYMSIWRARRLSADRIVDYGTELILQLPAERQGAMASIALTHMGHITLSTAEFLAHWAIGDKVEGGYGEHYNQPPRAQRGTALPFKKDWRRLHSPNWIRRYIKFNDDAKRHRALASRVIARIQGVDPALIKDGVLAFQADHEEAMARRRAYEAKESERFRDQWAIERLSEITNEPMVTLKKKYRRLSHKISRERRKVARRGIATAVSIVGQENTAAFVRGEPVMLEGINLNLAVQRRASVAKEGHGAIALAAIDKNGERLADLCFYIEDTPGIDQLTAVALHIEAGAESEIIKAANIIQQTPAGLNHPAFEEKRSERVENMARAIANPVGGNDWVDVTHRRAGPSFIEMARERDVAYWHDTKHIWTESFGVFMLGQKHHKMMLRNAEGAAT